MTIEVAATQATVRFTPSAKALYAEYKNRRLWLQCVLVDERRDGSFGDTRAVTTRITVRRTIRVSLDRPPGGFSYCRLSRSPGFYALRKEVVAIWLTRVGRLYLDERDTAALLFRLMSGSYTGDAEGWRYVSPAEFAARFGSAYRVEALPSPSHSPSPGAVGFWSDARKHAVIAKLTLRGTRFFLEMDDSVMRTNTVAYLRHVFG